MSIVQIVQDDLTTVEFDFSTQGATNPYGIRTYFARDHRFNKGESVPRETYIPSASGGGEIVRLVEDVTEMRWVQRFEADDLDSLKRGIGEAGRLLNRGGILKLSEDGSVAAVEYIDFEPSPSLSLFAGQALGLLYADPPEGGDAKALDIAIAITRQPTSRESERLAEVNLATNATLLGDGNHNGRPDGWAWDNAASISGETIDPDYKAYRFTVATADVRNLTQTTPTATVAPGDQAPFAFDARVVAVLGVPAARAVVRYMQADGVTPVGAESVGTLVALSTAWQRIEVPAPAVAGASTSRALVSIRVDNADGTAVELLLRNAQPENGPEPTPFRAGAELISCDPSATALAARMMFVHADGDAPAPAKLWATADVEGVKRIWVCRESADPVGVATSVLFKEWENGTLGADSTSQADTEAVGADALKVAYTSPDPSFVVDAAASGGGDTCTLPKPAGLVAGQTMVVVLWRADAATVFGSPDGFRMVGTPEKNVTNTYAEKLMMVAFTKLATAEDESDEVTDYTFSVLDDSGGANSFGGWIGAFDDVDQLRPIARLRYSQSDASTNAVADAIITPEDDCIVVAAFAGIGASGALTFGVPAGATPTYTERHDAQADVTYRAMAVYTGVLAAAGSTGDETSVASIAVDSCSLLLALRKAPAAVAPRSTVTFSDLQPGTYAVFHSAHPTAASKQRQELEYGLSAAPDVWEPVGPAWVADWTGAASFTRFLTRMMGFVEIPEDHGLDVLAIRLSAGLEAVPTAAAALHADHVFLAPANEFLAVIGAASVLTDGQMLVADAAKGQVFHLDGSELLVKRGTCEGPVPVTLEPVGAQLLVFVTENVTEQGYTDPTTRIDATQVMAVDYSPRRR